MCIITNIFTGRVETPYVFHDLKEAYQYMDDNDIAPSCYNIEKVIFYNDAEGK